MVTRAGSELIDFHCER